MAATKSKPRSKNVKSKPAPAKSRNGRATAKAADSELEIEGVRITHPDRILYPEDGITKGELAQYYADVADWILPYVAERPLTLVRCPEGHQGECFYQKHLSGYMPEAVTGVNIAEKGKPDEYVMIRDVAGLVSLVQIGVLEMHPWPARADNVERPDYLVFDLDPAEDVEWKDVVDGARDVRQRLESVGLKTYLRLSGGKGLHIVVPIMRRTSWDDVKAFTKSVAETMAREAPERYVSNMSKAKRRGKIFVDYLRNQRGATAIASYSTRARAGAPIAAPIDWDELNAKTRPNMYTITNLAKRLAKLKRDPWEGFFSTRQSLTQSLQKKFT